MTWTLYFDGSVKYKIGYFGYILFKDKIEKDRGYGMVGQVSGSLMAEKYALSYGLDSFIRHWDSQGSLEIFGDSKMLINSAEKDPDVSPKVKTIQGLGIPMKLKWIARDRNNLANDLARKMIEDSRTTNKRTSVSSKG